MLTSCLEFLAKGWNGHNSQPHKSDEFRMNSFRGDESAFARVSLKFIRGLVVQDIASVRLSSRYMPPSFPKRHRRSELALSHSHALRKFSAAVCAGCGLPVRRKGRLSHTQGAGIDISILQTMISGFPLVFSLRTSMQVPYVYVVLRTPVYSGQLRLAQMATMVLARLALVDATWQPCSWFQGMIPRDFRIGGS